MPGNLQFTKGPNMKFNHNDVMGCAYDSKRNRIVVVGGTFDSNRTEILDLSKDPLEWETGPVFPHLIRDHKLLYNQVLDKVVLIGGQGYYPNDIFYDHVWTLEEDQGWVKRPDLKLKTRRSQFVAFNVPKSFASC